MQLPRKIDDRLKDAIVGIQFAPGVPQATVSGYAHTLLKESFETIAPSQLPNFGFTPDGFAIDNQQIYFLSKDRKVRIDIDGQAVTFNVVQGYVGWAAYRTVISTCLTILLKNNIIRHVNRLGVRYISQFNNTRIADSIDIKLELGAGLEIQRSQLRLESLKNGYHQILTLVDSYPTESQQSTTNAGYFSLVDVDIIKYYPPEPAISIDSLLSHIDTAHHEQKLLFFGLLKADFLRKLNPEY